MNVTFNLPRPGGRRLTGTAVLSSLGSALFLAPGVLGFPGAELSPMLVTVGLLIPAGVGALTLTALERRIARDLAPTVARPMPEHDRVGAR
jgi:hypothetical protein